jgi:hypothetical protein
VTRPLAVLRVCASCEWIFRLPAPNGCPKCRFGHYGARYVYGARAYRYAVTQRPWFDKRMALFALELRREIVEAAPPGRLLDRLEK